MMSLSKTWKRTWAATGISAALLTFSVGLITFTNCGKSEPIFAGETRQLEKTVNQILSSNNNETTPNKTSDDNATARSIVSNAALDATVSPAPQKIRVLFIVGGHDYDKQSMERLLAWLSESDEIKIDRTHLPENRSLLSPELAKRYDCLIRYDQDQPTLSDEEMQSLNALYEAGIGVIALHHHIGAYSNRPDFWKTMGGYYVREGNKTVTGKDVPVSSWIDDVPMTIHIENPLHPITKGMSDFDVVDEAYDNVYVDEKATILLSTDEPKASPPVAWLWENGNSPVFTFLLGHGPSAFENPDFRQILRNAIFYLSMETNNRRASMESLPETDQQDQNLY
ncbi:MAG: ThuA domain-containing protein [Planctomycetia bacterium]|nr:ThuA domain-containing protein [Planctomycetia bacterium]